MAGSELKNLPLNNYSFLSGGGEMGALIRAKDWSKTPIGNPETWPQSLRTTLSIIINSKFPMFLWWGPELICFYNDAYRPSLGKNGKHPEILGMPAEKAWPEIWEIIQPLIQQVQDGGESTWSEDQLIPIFRNGKIEDVYWTFSYSPVIDENGNVAGVLVTCSETTEKINAFKNLEESNQRYLNNIMRAPAAMCIFMGKNHIVEIANQHMLNLMGQTESSVLNKPIFEGIPEAKGQGFEKLLDNVFNTGESFVANEFPVTLPRNGIVEPVYINFVFESLKDRDGKIIGIVAIAIDVSSQVLERKKMEDSERKFRTLADNMSQLAWMADENGARYWFNQRWYDYTGTSLENMKNSGWQVVHHPEHVDRVIKGLKNSIKTGEIWEDIYPLKSKEGNYNWFLSRASAIRDEDGKIIQWFGTNTDITVQKNAEDKIRESEERFRNVANSAPVMIWMAGTDKLANFFNKEWLHFTGRNFEEEKGNGWAEGVHPADFKRCLNVYFEAFDKQEEFYMEYRLKKNDGEYRWISNKGVPRFNTTGIFEGYIGACMDIHERVIYQKKLKEDEERLNIIINASELGTWELNLGSKEVHYSDRYLEILGHNKWIELTHEQILEQLHPEDLVIRDAAFKQALKTGLLHYESRVIWSDQSIHWMEGKGKVFYDEKNEASHLVGTIRDITEEKYFQQELQAREKKFRLLADSMPEFVWTGNEEGVLDYFNQSVYDYTGLTADQLINSGWLQIVHPDDREENLRLWVESVSTGKDFLLEHRFRRQDGEYRWQLSRAVPQKDAAGKIQMWVGTSTDIHQIKEQEQQKDLFISMASHELKTPVTSIKGYVQILQSMYAGSNDKFLKNSLNTVDKQIVTLTKLISELLDLSKIKAGSLVLNQESFKINDLVKDIIAEIKHTNSGKNIIFSKSANPDVYADRDRIGQVLINFLTNAVKYSPDSLNIKVKSVIKGNDVIISVHDSGIGINKTDQEKIFQRFYRVEGKNEKTFPGFGIGLFIASEIIKRHEGEIAVQSEPGKGSVFYFSLPLLK